jgi:hypothetical protein
MGIVEGLFGLSSQDVRQQQEAQQQQQIENFTRGNASEDVRRGAAIAAHNFSGAINGMMGVGSPQEERAKKIEAMGVQIDQTTPEGLMKGAQMFNQAGNPQVAQRLVQAATEMRDKQAKTRQENARALRDEQYDSLMRAAQLNALNIGNNRNTSGEKIATDRNTSGEKIATDRNTSGEKVAGMNNISRERISTADNVAGITKAGIVKPISEAQSYRERKEGAKAEGAAEQAEAITGSVGKDLADLMQHPGLKGNLGLMGEIPNVSGKDAANFKTKFDEIKHTLEVAGLQLVRQGGGIGSITEREWEKLRGMIASTDMAKMRSPEDFQAFVNKVNYQMGLISKASRSYHDRVYNKSPELSSAPNTSPKRIKFDAQGNPL